MSNQNKRPPNCGTDYCSCIECIYGDNGCVADEEQCNDGCLARESVIANALKLANDIDAEFFKGRISNHSGRQAAQMLRMLVDAPVQPVKQEPVAVISESAIGLVKLHSNGVSLPFDTPLYATPVRTKDLTDDEIMKINVDTASIVPTCDRQFHFARAVIAKFKEKNK